MKIGIQTGGTEGDIRPLMALAHGLTEAGHDVTMSLKCFANKDYLPYAQRLNLHVIQTPGVEVNKQVPVQFHTIFDQRNPIKQLKMIIETFATPVMEDIYATSEQLSQENDIVIGPAYFYPLHTAAEKFNKPFVNLILTHNLPSRQVTPIGLPKIGTWINPLWWLLAERIINRTFRPMVNNLREQAGLPLLKEMRFFPEGELSLIAVSPCICRRQPDWDEHYQVCGFLQIPERGEVSNTPDYVQAFLEATPKPIYITLGSMLPMTFSERKMLVDLFVNAVERIGCRTIIQVEPSDIGDLSGSDSIIFVPNLPHRRVFTRCDAVVHHGGAGTTQTTLRAGCPSIVVPHITDQFFWANELNRLGVAAKPLFYRSLTAERLAQRIQLVLKTPQLKERAQLIGREMKKERGVTTAVKAIEDWFSSHEIVGAHRVYA